MDSMILERLHCDMYEFRSKTNKADGTFVSDNTCDDSRAISDSSSVPRFQYSLAQPDPLPNASLRRGSGDIAFNDLFPSPTFW